MSARPLAPYKPIYLPTSHPERVRMLLEVLRHTAKLAQRPDELGHACRAEVYAEIEESCGIHLGSLLRATASDEADMAERERMQDEDDAAERAGFLPGDPLGSWEHAAAAE